MGLWCAYGQGFGHPFLSFPFLWAPTADFDRRVKHCCRAVPCGLLACTQACHKKKSRSSVIYLMTGLRLGVVTLHRSAHIFLGALRRAGARPALSAFSPQQSREFRMTSKV
eukprot:1152746-Pelagomonas_calceolata.AAC.6